MPVLVLALAAPARRRASESAVPPSKRSDNVGARDDSLEVSVVARNQALAPYTSLVLSRDCASYGTCSTLSPTHHPRTVGETARS
ncbi:hypothetical protein GGF50DRAFT_121888 [Schizophyllum commune]